MNKRITTININQGFFFYAILIIRMSIGNGYFIVLGSGMMSIATKNFCSVWYCDIIYKDFIFKSTVFFSIITVRQNISTINISTVTKITISNRYKVFSSIAYIIMPTNMSTKNTGIVDIIRSNVTICDVYGITISLTTSNTTTINIRNQRIINSYFIVVREPFIIC